MHRPGTDRGCVYPGRHHQGRAQGGGGRVRRRSAVRGHHAPLGRVARDGHELPVPGQVTIQRGHQPVGDVAGDGRAGMFEGASSFYRDISGWTFADNANTTGMFTGADTWLASSLAATGSTRRTGRPALGSSTRAWRTNASITDCARPAPAAGPTPPEMIPHSVSTPECDVSRPCCAEGRGGQLPRRRSHRRGVLQPRRGLRRRGDGRDAGLGRVAGDEHERAVLMARGSSTRIYRDGIPRASRPCTGCSEMPGVQPDIGTWDTSSVTTMRDVLRLRVQPAPIEMGRQLGHEHEVDVLRRQRIQHDAGGLGHIQSHGFS